MNTCCSISEPSRATSLHTYGSISEPTRAYTPVAVSLRQPEPLCYTLVAVSLSQVFGCWWDMYDEIARPTWARCFAVGGQLRHAWRKGTPALWRTPRSIPTWLLHPWLSTPASVRELPHLSGCVMHTWSLWCCLFLLLLLYTSFCFCCRWSKHTNTHALKRTPILMATIRNII